ncbi:MAG: DUF4197 domain-containing protein [Gallionella sp.]|nr:DUF4197 domain-containing protein [Gallionella sp.]MDD4958105.1 DUF4197 domain-containing protein [Gallionella sp.]
MTPTRFAPHILLISVICAAASAEAFDWGSVVNQEKLSQVLQKVAPASAPTVTAAAPSATGLGSLSEQDQVGGLKQALTQGVETAVTSLAKQNGYLGNAAVKIPLPASLQRVEGTMRRFGMGRYADDLTTSMNRAAEAAVPEAKNLLVSAVKNMSVTDAKNILLGSNDAATQYFRQSSEAALAGKFQPIVVHAMQNVSLAQKYDRFAAKGAKLGLVDAKDANLESYVTQKALDGLFVMMAEQEKAIRANPLQAVGSLAQKIFSAIKL